MPELKVVQLEGAWEVRVTPVPPHASYNWAQENVQFPKKPVRPMVEVRSELLPPGSPPEVLPALPESDEWNVWVKKMEEWQSTCDEIRGKAAAKEMDFSLDYAIVDWRAKGSDSEWQSEPPDEWQPRPALEKHGVGKALDRRLAFIYYELLAAPSNHDLVMVTAFPKGERDMSPVTEEEVEAAVSKFQSGGGVPGATRGVDTFAGEAGTGQKASNQYVNVRQGDVGGGQKASITRRLVYLLKGC